jgi:osmoprotectant transport system substrate-binding protein
MVPALEQGVIDLVPEYEGTLRLFLNTASDAPELHEGLEALLEDRGLTALPTAPAQNKNEVVVTEDIARLHGLRRISDLEDPAPDLVFGGPHECPTRPLCLEGLESIYGLNFETFLPIDTGGPLTLAALRSGEIDVALLFTTDPALADPDLLALTDDRHLQPPEHVVPVMSSEVLAALGADVRRDMNNVSSLLSTETLRDLNGEVDELGHDPAVVAARWLRSVNE